MPRQLWRLCVCHLLTWFSIIAEAVFYTDFMGQVIFRGDPMVHTPTHTLMSSVLFKDSCANLSHWVFCIPWRPHNRVTQKQKHSTLHIVTTPDINTTMSVIQSFCQVKCMITVLHFFHFLKAPANSTELQNYHRGVQMGCWGLVVYAATAAVCSGKTQTLFPFLD